MVDLVRIVQILYYEHKIRTWMDTSYFEYEFCILKLKKRRINNLTREVFYKI